MTRKRFLVHVSIIVGIAALALGVQLVVRHALDGAGERSEAEPGRIFEIGSPEAVSTVEIETDARILSFERVPIPEGASRQEGTDIVLDDGRLPARAERFEAFVETLHEMQRESLVTENPDRHRELMVERGTVFAPGYDYRVSFTDEREREFETMIGISADSPVVFVRRAGEDAVYRVEDTVSFYLDQGPRYWAEFRVFAGQFPLETIEAVEVDVYRGGEWNRLAHLRSAGSDRLRFEREQEADHQDYSANERGIRRVLSLEANGFLREKPQEPQWRITVMNSDRERVRVHVGEETGEGVYPAYIASGEQHLTASGRGPLALRAELFESMLSEME